MKLRKFIINFIFIALIIIYPAHKVMALTDNGVDLGVKYQTHIQNIGWQGFLDNGDLAGTTGRSLRLESINISVENPVPGMTIRYKTHVQNVGWLDWVQGGQASGTTGRSLRLEGIMIELVGAPAGYHVQYQVHVQNIGWQDWVQDGALAGTTGRSLRLEAIRIKISNSSIPNQFVLKNYTINTTLQQMCDTEFAVAPVFGNSSAKATKDQVMYYLDSNNFKNNEQNMQFMRNDSYVEGISVANLNIYLADKGIFKNQGQSFIDAAKQNNINVTYLVAHALWETGLGTSQLSNGISVSSVNGQPVPTKVAYNMFGIGAYDGNAKVYGAEAGYKNGWFSVDAAIKGGAAWISSNYIHSNTYNQNTVYKMRWNSTVTWHQYATDVHWAYGIASLENKVTGYCSGATINFDIPNYLQ